MRTMSRRVTAIPTAATRRPTAARTQLVVGRTGCHPAERSDCGSDLRDGNENGVTHEERERDGDAHADDGERGGLIAGVHTGEAGMHEMASAKPKEQSRGRQQIGIEDLQQRDQRSPHDHSSDPAGAKSVLERDRRCERLMRERLPRCRVRDRRDDDGVKCQIRRGATASPQSRGMTHL